VARLQSRLGLPAGAVTEATAVTAAGPAPPGGPSQASYGPPESVKRWARRLAGPVLDRVAARLAEAADRDTVALRADLAQLHDELDQVRADLEAEVVLLRAEIASLGRRDSRNIS